MPQSLDEYSVRNNNYQMLFASRVFFVLEKKKKEKKKTKQLYRLAILGCGNETSITGSMRGTGYLTSHD